MKTFIIALFMSLVVYGQSTGIYEVFWNKVDETDVVAYRIYWEERVTPTGFTIQHLLDLSVTDISSFFQDEVIADGRFQYIYEMVLSNDAFWVKVGVVAVNSIGQVGLLGSHSTPFQKESTPLPPNTPVGVGIRLKFQQP